MATPAEDDAATPSEPPALVSSLESVSLKTSLATSVDAMADSLASMLATSYARVEPVLDKAHQFHPVIDVVIVVLQVRGLTTEQRQHFDTSSATFQ